VHQVNKEEKAEHDLLAAKFPAESDPRPQSHQAQDYQCGTRKMQDKADAFVAKLAESAATEAQPAPAALPDPPERAEDHEAAWHHGAARVVPFSAYDVLWLYAKTLRSVALALRDEVERLRMDLNHLHGFPFSKRVHSAMLARIEHTQERAEKAETALAAMTRERDEAREQRAFWSHILGKVQEQLGGCDASDIPARLTERIAEAERKTWEAAAKVCDERAQSKRIAAEHFRKSGVPTAVDKFESEAEDIADLAAAMRRAASKVQPGDGGAEK
jgi:hypothetical protein